MKASPLHLAWCLIACACACADTQAQSNVTVYGLVDMNVGWTSNLARDGSNTLRVNSGGMNTSQWRSRPPPVPYTTFSSTLTRPGSLAIISRLSKSVSGFYRFGRDGWSDGFQCGGTEP